MKRSLANDSMPPKIIVDAQGDLVAVIRKSNYATIPVDFQTRDDLISLCIAAGGNKRSQGAMVRKLVKAEMARIKKSK